MDITLIGIIQFVHVVAAMLWVGGAVFLDLIVSRLSKKVPLPHQKSIGDLVLPRGEKFFATVSITTILSGIFRGIASGRIDSVAALTTPYGIVWLLSLVFSILILVWAATVIAPTGRRLYADESLWVPEPDGSANPALIRAGRRLALVARIETVVFGILIVAMIVLAIAV